MNKKLLILSAVILILLGCHSGHKNKDSNSSAPKVIGKTTSIRYGGEVQPCRDYYDELWCSDPKVLASDKNITIHRDKNGNPVILNPDINTSTEGDK